MAAPTEAPGSSVSLIPNRSSSTWPDAHFRCGGSSRTSVGVPILETTGGIDYGDPRSLELIGDTLIMTRVRHDVLGPLEAAERWPGFLFDGPVVYQSDAGRILADVAVRALQQGARAHGATRTVRGNSPGAHPRGG